MHRSERQHAGLWFRSCAVMKTYIYGKFPVFEGFNHMQYQIRDPEGFARMLEMIIETDNIIQNGL